MLTNQNIWVAVSELFGIIFYGKFFERKRVAGGR